MKSTLIGIILFVENVEKLKQFYMENFHLELAEEIESQWVLLKAGLCELGLHAIGVEYTQDDQTSGKFENNVKMVFEIEEDIFVAHKKLTANQVALTEIKTWDNYPYWLCDGKDPEGNVFQLRMKK
jgi:predicted enzyme related to lactoylglutathione lyase